MVTVFDNNKEKYTVEINNKDIQRAYQTALNYADRYLKMKGIDSEILEDKELYIYINDVCLEVSRSDIFDLSKEFLNEFDNEDRYY